jgi:hypothetical protein
MEFVRHNRHFYIPYPILADIDRECFLSNVENKRRTPQIEFIYLTTIKKLRSAGLAGFSELADIIEVESHQRSTAWMIAYRSVFARVFWTSSQHVAIDISSFEECKKLRRESALTNRALLKAYRRLYQLLIDLRLTNTCRILSVNSDVQRALMYDEDIDSRVLDNHHPNVFEAIIEGFVPIIVCGSFRQHDIDGYLKLWPNLVTVTACTLRKRYEKNPESVIARLDSTVINIPNNTEPINIEFIIQLFSKHRDFTPVTIDGVYANCHRRKTKWWGDLDQFVTARAIECAGQPGRPTLIKAYLERKSAKATIWKFWMRARHDPRMAMCQKRFLDDMQNLAHNIHGAKRHRIV